MPLSPLERMQDPGSELRAGLRVEIPAGRTWSVGAGFGIPGGSLAMADVQEVGGDGVEAISVLGCPGTSLGWPGFLLPGLQRDLGEVLPPLGGEGRGGEGRGGRNQN